MLRRALLVLAVPLALWGADRGWSHMLFLADDKLEGCNTGCGRRGRRDTSRR